MKRIGLLYYPRRADSSRLAQEVAEILRRHGVAPWCGSADDEPGLRQAAPGLELLITLGGDGTIVHAVRTVAEFGLPVMGVNLGRLGFLAEVEPNDVQAAIPRLLAGEYSLEERMMIRVELRRAGQSVMKAEAINDIVAARGSVVRAIRISVDIDGHYVMTQTADGMIICSPTGSTAYCLAAGGPIVAPDLNCLTITPIAAHITMAHAIVVPAERTVRLRLIKGAGAVLTVDGQIDTPLQADDEIYSTASDLTAKFVRFGSDGYFFETVLRRLRCPDQGPTP